MDKAKELDAMRMLLRGVKHQAIHDALRTLYGQSIASGRLVALKARLKENNIDADTLARSRLMLWDDGSWGYG